MKKNKNSSQIFSNKNLSPTNAILDIRNSQEMNADIVFLIDPNASNTNLLLKDGALNSNDVESPSAKN